ncbi:hypothetical protein HanXRQr2_Chr01g0001421 [Helianthus annuus]|uniref:Uncharacterized protein n=1 Tax=Helianthus annuus TaxID=4232 RepID=A0A9K3JSB7_HELAN|nr:hypothetical protein HanXRQr2_Chr01g0001421 [Helianthus annuus]KAJ0955310.1 hypothetical protein HanPSC8_Chr01g0001401 [Helianthus annuus]
MLENTMSSLLNWAAYAHRVVFESIRCQKVYFWMHLENSVTDFISSALAQQVNGAGLLHTMELQNMSLLRCKQLKDKKNIRGYIWGKNETFICTICRKIYQEH